jgi:hypothetical protein
MKCNEQDEVGTSPARSSANWAKMCRKFRSRCAAAAKRERRQKVADPSAVFPALLVYTPSKPDDASAAHQPEP